MGASLLILAFSLLSFDPLEAELASFPPKEVVRCSLDCNLRHAQWLYERWRVGVAWTEADEESYWINKRLGACWQHLECARTTTHDLPNRRKKIQLLRELLGEFAFWQGCMPPPVPVWRFKEGCPLGMPPCIKAA